MSSSLFSEDEEDAAGPSGTQHTPPPSPTLVPPRSRSPFFAPPQTSQATVVATSQRISSNKTGDINASLRATPPEIPALSNEQPDVPLNSHTNPPRVRRIRNPSGTVIHSPPPVGDQQAEELSAIVVTRPPRRAAAKKTTNAKPAPLGPRLISPVPAITSPPYRNTRSRSRSVEPFNPPIQLVLPKTRKRKGKEAALPHLEPLEEVMEEENPELLEVQYVDEATLTTRTAEATEEERDVEDLLVANATNISGVSQHQEDLGPETGDTSQESHYRGSVLSTDDEQADSTLRRVRELPRSQFPTSNILLDNNPEDILKRLEVRSTSSRRSSARPPFVMRSNLAKTNTEGRASSSRLSHLAVDLNPQPSTPVRSRAPTRKRSTSSAESFPLIGTRASAMKRKIQEEEKNNPYTPPPGTRAAKHRK